MRIFEMIMVALMILVLVDVSAMIKFSALVRKITVVTILITLTVHAVTEGLRWQMFVAYSVLGLYLGIYIYSRYIYKKEAVIRLGIKTKYLLICGIILTLFFLWLFPINELYVLKGNYNIGTFKEELVDEDRMEIYGERPGSPRRITFQVWYPTDDVAGDQTPWLYDGVEVARSIPRMYSAPFFMLDHLKYVQSNSFRDVPISQREESYPVILISHGWTGFSALHSDLGEMLASHGYIVLVLNHTYGAATTVFDNGDVVLVDNEALPNREDTDDFLVYANKLVNTYSQDSALVLDYLEDNKAINSILGNRLDMERVGVLGHSTGGGGVVELALNDRRVDAVMGFDAWVEPIGKEMLGQGLKVPSLFIRSEQWVKGPNNEYLEILVNKNSRSTSIVQIDDSNHQAFSTLYMLNPMAQVFGFLGKLDSQVNAEIQQRYVLTFFDQILKGHAKDVAELSDEFYQVNDVETYDVK